MRSPFKRILFVSHEASLTGAPILLLNLINLIKNEENIDLKIILKNKKGELINNFRNNKKLTFLFDNIGSYKKFVFISRIFNFLSRKIREIKIQTWINQSDIVVLNTITQGDFVKSFTINKIKIVSYIHELDIASELFTSSFLARKQIDSTQYFFVPCTAVRTFLIKKYEVSENFIYNLNYYVPFQEKEETVLDDSSNLKKFTVGFIGTLDWRKGADLLPQILKTYFENYPNDDIEFVWKGANLTAPIFKEIQFDLRKMCLADKIRFEGPTNNPSIFYSSIDILVLCSREDPYPLVVLEAAKYKKPTICFENSGGAPEFVDKDCGIVVPYLNLSLLAEAINIFYSNNSIKLKMGKNSFDKYQRNHADPNLILDQFNCLLQNL